MFGKIASFIKPTLYAGFYFKVKIIDEKAPMSTKIGLALEESFEEVSGLSFELKVNEMMVDNEMTKIPVGATYSNLVLKRALVAPTSELLKWCMEGPDSNFTKFTLRNIIITLMNTTTGLANAEWKVINAYPIKYRLDGFNATSSQIMMETIEIMYQKFEMIPVSGSSGINKVVSALNKTQAGQQMLNNISNRKDATIKKATEGINKAANNLTNKVTNSVNNLINKGFDKTDSLIDKIIGKGKEVAKNEVNKKEDPKPTPKKEEPKPVEKKEEPKPVEKKEEPKPVEKKEEPKKEEPKPAEKKEEPKKEEAKPAEKKEEPKKEEPKPTPKKKEQPNYMKSTASSRAKQTQKYKDRQENKNNRKK
jgi:phage tail-like protein